MRGGQPFDETPLAALRMLGLPEAEIAQVRAVLQARAAHECLEVWPEHWHALHLFDAMGTQWRAHPPGLDYAALPAVMALLRDAVAHRQPRAVVFAQLRVMEHAAIQWLHEQSK